MSRYMVKVLFLVSLLWIAIFSCSPAVVQKAPPAYSVSSYQSEDMCKGCHDRAYKEYKTSMHSRSSSNPRYQAMYFKKVVPRIDEGPHMAEEARQCLACHHPIAFMTSREPIRTEEESSKYHISGGTCDFCHTINGIKDKEPGNGNYISEPGDKKYGPHKAKSNWHHIYSPVQSSSKFCGTCHNDNNHHGLETKSTYTEWKESPFYKRRVTCQDCHMSVEGFISDTVPVFESGRAAVESNKLRPPHRRELHTHEFPGAYTEGQLSGAVKLEVGSSKHTFKPGEELELVVIVDSRRSGHKLPTGATPLRLLWLEVEISGAGRTIQVKAEPHSLRDGLFDVSGRGMWDAEFMGDSVPPGHRLYRQVFLDKDGRQTIYFIDAVEVAFDNRLEAAVTRAERYSFKAPREKSQYTITATLKYLAYPNVFARELGVDEARPLVVARSTMRLLVK